MPSSRVDTARHVRDLAGSGVVVGVGVDLVDLDRFRRVLQRTPSVVGRMFTAGERSYAELRPDPTERYAARFAAKEAVMKALRVGVFQVPLTDIEIVRDDDSGAPFVQLHGQARVIATERGVERWHVTMSHIDTAAEAIALALALAPTPLLPQIA